MKTRRNTPQSEAAAQASASAAAMQPDVVPVSEIAGEIASIAAPKLADSVAPSIISLDPKPLPEPNVEAPHARREPVLPRAATLGPPPAPAPRVEAAAPNPNVKPPVGTETVQRPRRFALLAISLALSASLGGLGGSFALTGVGHLLAPPPPPPPAHVDASEEIRALKDSLAQLRTNLKSIGDQVAAVRTALNASFSSSTAQFAKIAEAIDKLDRRQAERHVAAAAAVPPASASQSSPAPETTGSTGSAPGAKPARPGVVDGWVLRKAYRGAALVEGRYGIIEIEPGDTLPGVGRVEEIKRQDGRWVVVTGKGLILGVQ